MKYILIIPILFFIACNDNSNNKTKVAFSATLGKVYYASTTGNDANSGSFTSPFKTWQKLSSVLVAGDTGYIRGGTYPSPLASGKSDWLITISGRNGTSSSPIVISSYKDEYVVLDLDKFFQTNNTTAIRINNCSWMKFYGLNVANLLQNTNGNIVAGFDIHDSKNMSFENCSVANIGGAGWRQAQGCDNFTYTNCDASKCADPISTGGGNYGNADGFDANYGAATYINCRAWWNSDDGFDCYYNDSKVTYKGCWSFYNGYKPGTFIDPGPQADGMGYKWGISTTAQPNTILRTYNNCLSYQNKSYGFDQNVARLIAEFYNNTSYKNAKGGWATGYNISPREPNVLKQNVSYLDPIIITDPNNIVQSNNSWNNTLTKPVAASFISLNAAGMDGARSKNGSLPEVQFLRLTTNSNLLGLGAYPGGVIPPPVILPPVVGASSASVTVVTMTGKAVDPQGQSMTYLWTQVDGTPVTINNASQIVANATFTAVGTYHFKFTATNTSNLSSSTTIPVIIQ